MVLVLMGCGAAVLNGGATSVAAVLTICLLYTSKTNDSYRILRNHIYTVDVRVLSVDDVEINMDLLDWREEININGDVPGEGFTVSKGEVALLPNITDPTSVFTVSTLGRPDKTISISIVKADKQTEITQMCIRDSRSTCRDIP